MGKLAAIKQKTGEALLVGVDVLGLFLSVTGASLVAFLGKLMFAVVLLALALGFFLRLSGRRKGAVMARPPSPRWVRPVSGLLGAVETGLLVEATDLPVRFHQPGFEPWHWLLVLLAVTVAYALHMRLFAALVASRHVTASAPHS